MTDDPLNRVAREYLEQLQSPPPPTVPPVFHLVETMCNDHLGCLSLTQWSLAHLDDFLEEEIALRQQPLRRAMRTLLDEEMVDCTLLQAEEALAEELKQLDDPLKAGRELFDRLWIILLPKFDPRED